MRHYINIEGIRFTGYHGCLPEEALIGGLYQVDVYITTDFTVAAQEDDLSKTIDYCQVFDISKREMAIRSQLIEQVCARIFTSLCNELPPLKSLRVKVTKFTPPMNGDVREVSVEMQEEFN
jgi:7,8-dihydroneopterin aldolase/epimerase/oxygenase